MIVYQLLFSIFCVSNRYYLRALKCSNKGNLYLDHITMFYEGIQIFPQEGISSRYAHFIWLCFCKAKFTMTPSMNSVICKWKFTILSVLTEKKDTHKGIKF